MDPSRTLQQLLFRGLGTTSLVAERLRGVTQAWVSSGRLDPSQASALVDDVLASVKRLGLGSSGSSSIWPLKLA